MNDIQVGDNVVAVHRSTCGVYAKGAIGKVLRSEAHVLDVRFTAGCWNKKEEEVHGGITVFKHNFRKHIPYAATFTDPAAVVAVAKGHVPDSGLQRHSLGHIYPLAVVTWANKDEPHKFTVENLETGEQATVVGELMRFTDYATAYATATELIGRRSPGSDKAFVPVTWVKR